MMTNAQYRETRLWPAGLLLLALAGCSAPGERGASIEEQLARRSLQAGAEAGAIHNSRISGWNSLDDRHLIVQTGPGSHYLVTLLARCEGLRHSETVGFSSTTNRVTRFDVLVTERPGNIVERCPIDSIRELEPLAEP